jgi:hypothetical protein
LKLENCQTGYSLKLVKIEVPQSFADALGYLGEGAGEAAVIDLVLSAYAQRRVSAGRACELLTMSRSEFERLLVERALHLPYDEAELARDLVWARSQ